MHLDTGSGQARRHSFPHAIIRATVLWYRTHEVRRTLTDPEIEVCHNLKGVAALPALLGRNSTNQTATVFQDDGCEVDTWWVVNLGLHTPALARFRSVVFG
ncbi:hypothetical protein ACFWIY_05895 [Streptomyces sioyaensis]|uniref:hypothetical protein n=1 Tax=Streptomyces sioyaensis TaxID=67364 RepID=UPI00364863C8